MPTSGIGTIIPSLPNAQSVNQAFQYDNLDRLTSFIPGNPAATTAATGLALLPKETFTYDAIGNRTSRTTLAPGAPAGNAQTATYAYPNLSTTSGTKRHILNTISGANAWTYAYDASGNTTAEGSNVANAATTQFFSAYDAKNRLNKTQIGSNATDAVTYKINAFGQRVQKTGSGIYAFNAATASSFQFNARYMYDESGNLIGEYAPDGKLIAETVWFNGMPIATLRPKGSNSGTPLGIAGTGAATANNTGANTAANPVNVDIFYLHPDHLGTPRAMTRSVAFAGATTGPNAVNKAVWMWNSDPFGTTAQTGAGGSANSAPNKNPQLVTGTAAQIAAASFEQNLRMPGQIQDQETKKFYNYFRTLNPVIGQYDSSDPIGLGGGLNTYAYVANDPLTQVDMFGLANGPAIGWLNAKRDWKLPPGQSGVCCENILSAAGGGRYPLIRHCFLVDERGQEWHLANNSGVARPLDPGVPNSPRTDRNLRCAACEPKEPCTSPSGCFRGGRDAYPPADPYPTAGMGNNSNTYAATLFNKCCKGGWPTGLGVTPGAEAR